MGIISDTIVAKIVQYQKHEWNLFDGQCYIDSLNHGNYGIMNLFLLNVHIYQNIDKVLSN